MTSEFDKSAYSLHCAATTCNKENFHSIKPHLAPSSISAVTHNNTDRQSKTLEQAFQEAFHTCSTPGKRMSRRGWAIFETHAKCDHYSYLSKVSWKLLKCPTLPITPICLLLRGRSAMLTHQCQIHVWKAFIQLAFILLDKHVAKQC